MAGEGSVDLHLTMLSEKRLTRTFSEMVNSAWLAAHSIPDICRLLRTDPALANRQRAMVVRPVWQETEQIWRF
jgi:hypothetical protein